LKLKKAGLLPEGLASLIFNTPPCCDSIVVMFSEIKNLIIQRQYAVIHFNNGRHEIEYDAAQYDIAEGYKALGEL